ncbi:MAG TPA: energy transducer TonB [Acidobacteriaceae bacterium]|nr:energy transducer TonB [Acidobacteriaceae bacterium]
MRRMILTTLVLLPVTGMAYAATSAEPQPSSSSVRVAAELKAPAAASLMAVSANSHAAVREMVHTQVDDSFLSAALHNAGSLEYAMYGSIPTETSAPAVTRAVEVGLTPEELAAQPAVTNVVVHATVDSYGYPRNLTVTKSAGSLVDQRVLAAVGQYRFKPATLDNRPVDAAVTISVKIAKP